MRRLALAVVAFLSLPLVSCLGPQVWDDSPSSIRRPQPVPTPCREVSRVHCDIERCRGANLDWVEFQCSGGRMSRCVVAKGCGTAD